MRLGRFGERGKELPCVIDANGVRFDISHVIDDLTGSVLADDATMRRIAALDTARLEAVGRDVRAGAVLAGIGKIICIGLNYSDHAAETGAEIPSEPVVFFKATTSVGGPDDDVVLPRNSKKTDWEVELGVVMGSRASYVDPSEALQHVAGYCIVNDLSERAFQLERGGQWVKGKSCDTFAPLGPWLVTRDEVQDPHDLKMTLDVNGRRFQDGSTRRMIFRIPFLVSYLSQFMTLEPGDIISTGTPPGVGLGQTPPVYLKPGDIMELEITGLGRQRQKVVDFDRGA